MSGGGREGRGGIAEQGHKKTGKRGRRQGKDKTLWQTPRHKQVPGSVRDRDKERQKGGGEREIDREREREREREKERERERKRERERDSGRVFS